MISHTTYAHQVAEDQVKLLGWPGKSEQIGIGVDFVNIFDDIESVLQEAHEVNNPSSYQPKSRASFRTHEKESTKEKSFTTKKIPEGKKKKKGLKRNEPSHDVEGSDEQIVQKINKASKIIYGRKGNVHLNSRSTGQNPPMLIFTNGLGIRRCQGCKKYITTEQQAYPRNMVLRRWALVGYFNKVLNHYIYLQNNIHIHLSKKCLRDQDHTVEYRDIIATDEVFEGLTEEQMEVLNEADILQYIVQNKKKSFVSKLLSVEFS